MVIWSISIFLGAAVLFLNYSATRIVLSSNIHTEKNKIVFIGLIWVFPILGVIAAMMLINRDIKKNRRKLNEEIAPVIRQLGDKIKHLEADLLQERPSGTSEEIKKKLH